MSQAEELRKELREIVNNSKSDTILSEAEVVKRALEIEQLLNVKMRAKAVNE